MRSGELFAGVGGLGMAVDAAFGTTPAWFCEFDDAPSKVLAYRHPDIPNYGDVTAVNWKHTPRVQVLAGGFPCQDVSLAGRRRGMGEGTRSGLWSEYARAIDTIRPDWVVIENVRGLLSADANSNVEPCPLCVGDNPGHVLRALGAVLGDLADLGFDAEWTGIRASDVGAPHGRFRVFILAWPAERTTTDAGGGRGRRGTVASGRGTRAWADAPVDGADPRDDGRLEGVTLLGTPRTSSSHGAGDLSRRQASTNIESQVLLLPTLVAQPSGNTPEDHLRKKPGREVVTDLAIIAENGLIDTGGRLLPTSGAYDGERGGSQHPDKRRAGNHSVSIQDVAEHLTLLPTPTVGNATGGNAQRGGDRADEKLLPGIAVEISDGTAHAASEGRPDQGLQGLRGDTGSQAIRERAARGSNGVPEEGALLAELREHAGSDSGGLSSVAGAAVQAPGTVRGMRAEAPSAACASHRPQPGEQRAGEPDDALPELSSQETLAGRPEVRQSRVEWGPYEPAIRRWETVLGRPAPDPVTHDGRNGKARLNPELTEWMMGWPAGHVTDPAIGLSRAEQLKPCGNGVVPQQAAAALREMLARPGVPEVRTGVKA